MFILLTIVHVIVCIFLIIVVLLQSGKAADLAGAFGGMGSQTAFGPRGSATLLSKATTASAILFMITSLSLSILATRGSTGAKTVLDTSSGASKTAPAKAPAPAPGPTIKLPNGQSVPLKIPTAPAGQKAPGAPAPAKK
ncbi:MAG TPA: preprotein translocase subunit SecG [Bryobacteraceae bacterium]|nr:preprotein translocase subunit SecG [Bryobacteraceae bacterium]